MIFRCKLVISSELVDLFSALFLIPIFLCSAETDDYAEIIDEEDTYTMPSSK